MDSIDEIKYRPIGIIHSSFREPEGTPIQPPGAIGTRGTVEVFPQYIEGLIDIDGFSHIILIYHFHLSRKPVLLARPFLDDKEHGIFAIRGVSRPNPIGISMVRLVRVEDNIVHIQDLDIIDGTPLLDIKPYVPEFDIREVTSVGWYAKKVGNVQTSKDDGRFIKHIQVSKGEGKNRWLKARSISTYAVYMLNLVIGAMGKRAMKFSLPEPLQNLVEVRD